jgi:hypothetical protein
MTTPSINGVSVPASMAGRGNYTFKPQESNVAASGDVYARGNQSAEWVFPYMTQTELDWWYTQLAGGLSLTLTSTELWQKRMIEQTFTGGKLLEPVCRGGYHLTLFHDVLIPFDSLMPLVAPS